MNGQLIRMVVAAALLSAVLLSLACSPGAQNSNNNTSNTANTAQKSANVASVDAEKLDDKGGPCDPDVPVDTRHQRVSDKLLERIQGNTQLKEQYDRGLFKFQVTLGPGINPQYLDLFVEGRIGTSDQHQDQMKNLTGFIRSFIKRKCTEKVYFVPAGTFPVQDATVAAARGFQWFGCEDPMVPCPSGECLMSCPSILPSPTPAPMSNTNGASPKP